VGEKVLKGQVIARAGGYVGVPLHASTSGRIADIGDHPVPHPEEQLAPCIVIEPDGRDEWCEIRPTEQYASVDPVQLQAVIRECGIIGLGGAGFPTHVKINEGVHNAVETLIINGVECEPYITCDDRLIQEKADYVVAGTRMIRHAVQARHCVIAVEDDMPAAYRELERRVGDDIELIKVPTRYPAGGEKQLIRVITGREVPSGGLPIHIGIVMHNVATAAAVYRAVTRGEPVVSRYVTVTGNVRTPRNLQVLLGTPVLDCLKACGFEPGADQRVIIGGPMMGAHIQRPDIPVIKTTNCVLVEDDVPRPPAMPCIRCGACMDVCPVRLQPQELHRHAVAGNTAGVLRHHLFDCIECGCCATVCPSRIPLVRQYRQAKTRVAEQERRRSGADQARARFLARQQRLQAERADEGSDTNASPPDDREQKRAFIRAAVARSRARRESRKPGDGGD
jgi:electron transport complex protein RnfC